mmetsp:Transcript_302/g.494  ORF Transcript_302/g.494 Transcript_302/m.494 type:complete len:352 (-) Transcript_302:296-1351(-)
MVQTTPFNPTLTYPYSEDTKLQELNKTTSSHGEDLTELCIEDICQSWKDHSRGRDSPDSSASPRDPFDEITTTIDSMEDINYASVFQKNLAQNDTSIGNPPFFPTTTCRIVDEHMFEPIQGENELDLETIAELFMMEEERKLVPSKKQPITSELKAVTDDPLPQPDAIESETNQGMTKKKMDSSSLPTKDPNRGRWSTEEHNLFLQGIEVYGRQWRSISILVKTRTPTQVRTHAQKTFSKDPALEERSMLKNYNEQRPTKRQRVGEYEGAACGTFQGQFDHEHGSGGKMSNLNQGRWLKREHDLFLQGINQFGKDWKKIAGLVRSRTILQIRTHAQKYFEKLDKSPKGAST